MIASSLHIGLSIHRLPHTFLQHFLCRSAYATEEWLEFQCLRKGSEIKALGTPYAPYLLRVRFEIGDRI
jgi:hypothetical protein